jgi:hypothetical protein
MRVRKQPRDFVQLDELWEADEHWPGYYIEQKVWVYADEYHAELAGDEDYSRIIVQSSDDAGWLLSRRLKDKNTVKQALQAIQRPVCEQQLEELGFTRWKDSYL